MNVLQCSSYREVQSLTKFFFTGTGTSVELSFDILKEMRQPFVRPLPGVQTQKNAILQERLLSEKRSTFVYSNLTLSESIFFADHEKQIQKFVAHRKVCQNRLKEKSSGRMRTKRQTARCVAPCVPSQVLQVTDKLPSFPSKAEFSQIEG